MATLTGFLSPIWISFCIVIAIFLSVLGFAGLICTVAPPDVRIDRWKAFTCFVWSTLLAGLFYIHVRCVLTKPQDSLEFPETRDILLTVPQDSSVNTQITSGNNTVNITDL